MGTADLLMEAMNLLEALRAILFLTLLLPIWETLDSLNVTEA